MMIAKGGALHNKKELGLLSNKGNIVGVRKDIMKVLLEKI